MVSTQPQRPRVVYGMVDEDDDEPVLGRDTLKRRSQELLTANVAASKPLQFQGKQPYPQHQQHAPQRQPLGQPPNRNEWNLTPDMMNQPWGALV
eukprot:4443126-Prymnesium_polylepis.1